jgi:hypothetical protein
VRQSSLSNVVRQIFSRSNLVSWALVSFVFALSGPFETYAAFGFLPRLVLWLALVALAFVILVPIRVIIMSFSGLGLVQAASLAGVIGGLPVGLIVPALLMRAGVPPSGMATLLEIWALTASLAFGIAVVRSLVLHDALGQNGGSNQDPAPRPKLLGRLPAGAGERILHLSVDDHYVEVWTETGPSRVLMRLSDAIDEASPIAGMRVHRSHWVALAAVERIERDGARSVLMLVNGTRVPVSRGYEGAVLRLRDR